MGDLVRAKAYHRGQQRAEKSETSSIKEDSTNQLRTEDSVEQSYK